MFFYEKFLQRPIKIKNTNPRLANIIVTQYGGAYCESLSKKRNTPKVFNLWGAYQI